MLVTKEEIKMEWRGYDLTIPAGTPTTHQTAHGPDENYNFISSYSWYPEPRAGFVHDASHYGIDIPANQLIEEG